MLLLGRPQHSLLGGLRLLRVQRLLFGGGFGALERGHGGRHWLGVAPLMMLYVEERRSYSRRRLSRSRKWALKSLALPVSMDAAGHLERRNALARPVVRAWGHL